jgi:hypothetical protein
MLVFSGGNESSQTHYPDLNAGVQWRKKEFPQTLYPALNAGAQWRKCLWVLLFPPLNTSIKSRIMCL